MCFSVQLLFKILLKLSENKKTQKVQDNCSFSVEIINVQFVHHQLFTMWYFQEPLLDKDFTSADNCITQSVVLILKCYPHVKGIC